MIRSSPPLHRILALAAVLLALGGSLAFASGKSESRSQQPTTASADTGVLVYRIEPGSPAEKAGIVRGDVITAVDSTAVDTPDQLVTAVTAKEPGEEVALTFRHGDDERKAKVTLGDRDGTAYLGVYLAPSLSQTGTAPQPVTPTTPEATPAPAPQPRYNLDPRIVVPMGTGALVTSVAEGSPAATAGLKQKDIILSVDGTRVDATHDLAALVGAKKPGDQVTLSVRRPAARGSGSAARPDVQVTLGEHPQDKTKAYLGVEYLPLSVRSLGRGLGRNLMAGVLVKEVVADGPAAKAGLESGVLITAIEGIRTTSPQEVIDAVAKHRPGDTVTVTVRSYADGSESDVQVTLGEHPEDKSKAYLGVQMSSFFGLELPDGTGRQFRRLPVPQPDGTPGANQALKGTDL